jgi:hypothetical protein
MPTMCTLPRMQYRRLARPVKPFRWVPKSKYYSVEHRSGMNDCNDFSTSNEESQHQVKWSLERNEALTRLSLTFRSYQSDFRSS